ncbi:MAG: carboxypeptidase regulatory-like domain-containing protein [Terracidiphilus sp.]
MHCFTHFLLALALGVAAVMAHAEGAPPTQAVGTATVRGHVADPSGALIPGAKVTIANALGVAIKTTTSDATGDFTVTGLAPGNYIVEVEMPGFALYTSPTFALAAGESKRADVTMAIEVAKQQVEVSSEGGPAVSTEAGANTSAIVLKGKDLDALSDDPDELSSELQALAGPAAGPNGGQIYIDGFTGGQLPPKSAIREIRINTNPFSAQFDRLGYGRIEILTKPGTDTLHGRFFGMGNDSAFNTLNPFTKTIPSYHSYMINGTVSGPLSKSASFFFSAEQRNNQNDSIYTVQQADLASSGVYYVPTTVTGSTVTIVPYNGGLLAPETHTNISPRVDLQLGQKNTLTLRYQFFRNNESGNLGATSLPSQANSADTIEHSVQFDDTQVVTEHLVNETRFEFRRAIGTTTPVSTAPSLSVSQAFNGGGNGSQYSSSHSDHYELQNFTTLSAGKQAIEFGIWGRDNREAITTDSGFNGSFSFAHPSDYAGALNELYNGTACPTAPSSSDEVCDTSPAAPGVNSPISMSYTTGNEKFQGNVFDVALFVQDDWTVNRFLTLSGGLRLESQNHTGDHADWAPRVAFAYALDGHKKGAQPKTVLRGGFGMFYDRFGVGNLMSLEELNNGPNSQKQYVINDPTCFTNTSLSPNFLASCGSATANPPQIYQISPTYRSPDSEIFSTSLEHQLTKAATLTFTYVHSYGVHQLVTRDSNAYLPGTYSCDSSGACTASQPRPDPSLGIVHQYDPEAIFKENQIIVNVRAQLSPKFSVMGFYNASWANSDGGDGSSPSNSYNLMQDYGRAGFVHPQWVFLMGSYTGPWGLSFNPFLIAQAGQPYSVSTPFDLTGDTFYNDRPSYGAASNCSTQVANYFSTPFGCLDAIPQPGEAIVPTDLGNSPSAVAVNLRLSRTFGIGPKVEATGGPPRGGGGPGGGGGHGGGRGGFGGGFGGPFGGGGGMHGGISNTGRKYALNFSAQALNLFNDIDYGTPVGNIENSRFGQSTSLQKGIFTSGSAARRIFFQAAFQF